MLLKYSVHCIQFSLHIKKLVKYLLTVLVLFSGFNILSAPSSIQGIRFWQSPDKTRVVFDMSASPNHQLLLLKNPHRVVIDIEDGGLDIDLTKVNINSTLIEQIRTSRSPARSSEWRARFRSSRPRFPSRCAGTHGRWIESRARLRAPRRESPSR